MATAIALNENIPTDTTQSTQIVRGSITLTGNYGISGGHGDILSFANIYGIQSRSLPVDIIISETPAAGTAPTGYIFGFAPGTTNANGKLTIMSGVATEYTQGSAYSAALLAAKLYFVAAFPTFL
jgi:hypothetical protein